MNWLLQALDPATISAFLAHFRADMQQPAFWLAVGKIIWINVLLSGDNALVIALACRALQPRERLWGMVIGAGIAVVLLIAFTAIVATLMSLPYLKLISGLALILIAAKLLVPEQESDQVAAGTSLWHAVRIVVIADIIMSLDNVIAVAAAANGGTSLLVFGLAISIPIIIAGAALIMALLDRLPFLVWFGAALLGWIAGEVISSDPVVLPLLHSVLEGQIVLNINGASTLFGTTSELSFNTPLAEFVCSLAAVILVLTWGSLWRRRTMRAHKERSAIPVSSGDLV